MNETALWDDRKAMEYLCCTKRMLKQLRDQRAFDVVRLGHRTIRYKKKDLDAFIQKSRVQGLSQ